MFGRNAKMEHNIFEDRSRVCDYSVATSYRRSSDEDEVL